jgi:hypothetical protein
MRHSPFVRWEIYFAKFLAGGCSSDDSHMLPGAGSGEEKLVLVQPRQSGRVIKEEVRIAAKHRNGIGGPIGKLQDRIRDLGPTGRERQIVFQARVVRQAPPRRLSPETRRCRGQCGRRQHRVR